MKSTFIILFITLLINVLPGYSQKFYIEKTEEGYEQPIIDKLLSNNYKVSFNKDSATFIIKCMVIKTRNDKAKGSIMILNKSQDIIGKTEEISGFSSIYNGFANCKIVVTKKLAEKYLIPLVNQKIIK